MGKKKGSWSITPFGWMMMASVLAGAAAWASLRVVGFGVNTIRAIRTDIKDGSGMPTHVRRVPIEGAKGNSDMGD